MHGKVKWQLDDTENVQHHDKSFGFFAR